MAAPSYSTDLSPINLSTGTWGEFTGAADGSGPTENDVDNFIAGANCTTEQVRSGGDCSMYAPANTTSVASGDAVFFWFYHGAMPTVDIFANDGYQAAIGHSSSAYDRWTVVGRDTLPKGGWFSVAIDPTSTPTNDYGGGGSGTLTYFGSRIYMDGSVSKGNPYANDYIRHGRSLIVTLGDTGDPGTFAGAAAINDAVANRWGLFEAVAGGYSQKGLFQLGSAGTAVHFEAENISIAIEDTIHCGAGFNEFEVLNASSVVNLGGVQISALGSQSPGLFTVTDNADVSLDGCTFNDMGAFSLLSNTTVDGNTFRRCGQVTQGGADIDECLFENSTASASVLSDNVSLVTNSQFVSDGSNHAIQLTSTGEYSLSGHTFTNYATSTGSTGNEVIYNNSGGAVTLNASDNVGVVSYRNGSGASTTIELDPIVLTLTGCPTNTEVTIVNASTRAELHHTENSSGDVVYSYDTGGTVVDVLIHHLDYDPHIGQLLNYTLPSISTTLPITLVADTTFSNP